MLASLILAITVFTAHEVERKVRGLRFELGDVVRAALDDLAIVLGLLEHHRGTDKALSWRRI